MVPTKEELRIAELEDALDHIRAVCPQMMSFTINLDYIARYARAALKDATPWTERVTRQPNNSTAKQG